MQGGGIEVDRFREYIDAILKGVNISKKGKKELVEEFYDHLDMLKKEFIENGYSKEQAELMSIERFGEIEENKKKLKGVYTPFRRWKDQMNEKKILKEILQWSSAIFISLLISLSIKSYGFAATGIKQCSMQSTLYEGQHIIENKLKYHYSEPRRGDIVVINNDLEEGFLNILAVNTKESLEVLYKKEENENKRLIKRIIGIPGDMIDIKDGKVYLNGQFYEEPYVNGDTSPNNMVFPITIPEKKYFVMGDNREYSLDSRDFGLIDNDKIEGKAVIRLWPLDKFGSLYE